MRQSNTTVHIAVAYMDYVMSKHDSSIESHYLIAITCLVLAAKYDELDKNIPPVQDYIKAAYSKLPCTNIESVKECEVMCLKILDWNLRIVTPLNFIEILLTQGVLFSEDLVNGKDFVTSLNAREIKQKAVQIADLSLFYYELLQYPSSIISISCIIVSRLVNGIIPVWSSHLQYATGYKYEQLTDCFTLLRQ